MGKTLNLSVIILLGGKINKDLLKKCLLSVSFADEVITVDTVKLNGSFDRWRNEGLWLAKGNWILYIDSDEEVASALKDEIIKIVKDSNIKNNAYAIPRRNFIFGQEFKHSGQWPDYQKRLFKKETFSRWVGDLHEEPVFTGEIAHLINPIIHHKDITISEMIEKTNRWSEIEGELLFNSNHPKMNLVRFMSVALREFFLRFVKELCFLDGPKGVIYGIYQIYSRLISYSKLWEKQLSTIRT